MYNLLSLRAGQLFESMVNPSYSASAEILEDNHVLRIGQLFQCMDKYSNMAELKKKFTICIAICLIYDN